MRRRKTMRVPIVIGVGTCIESERKNYVLNKVVGRSAVFFIRRTGHIEVGLIEGIKQRPGNGSALYVLEDGEPKVNICAVRSEPFQWY